MNPRKIKPLFLLTLCFLLSSSALWACTRDSDCETGNHCERTHADLDGICLPNSAPKPIELDPKAAAAVNAPESNCQLDLDCGSGGKCVKADGIHGVCYEPGTP